mmetsp:Transcript_27678/g.32753  ORF Transcript_27678/g.32753 Transcript_27678/m.32753 type:complete len:124 (+) Transcript_27678:121-492(+)
MSFSQVQYCAQTIALHIDSYVPLFIMSSYDSCFPVVDSSKIGNEVVDLTDHFIFSEGLYVKKTGVGVAWVDFRVAVRRVMTLTVGSTVCDTRTGSGNGGGAGIYEDAGRSCVLRACVTVCGCM